MGISPISAV